MHSPYPYNLTRGILMKVLVLGGSYFIGWHLVNSLAQNGHQVWVFNRGTRKREYPPNVHHLVGDGNNTSHMLELINTVRYDAVFDILAATGEQTALMIKNFLGKISRFFYLSSAAVYLQSEVFPIREDFPVGKHHNWGIYGINKLDSERLLLEAYNQTGFPVTIFRPSYVYGPDDYKNREKSIFDRISKSRKILIPGDGNALIQLGHVADLTSAWLIALSNPQTIGKIYNVSGDEYITLNGIVQFASRIIQKEAQIIHIDTKKFGLTDRDIFPFYNSTFITDIQKIKRDLAVTPRHLLMQGLEESFELWLESKNEFVSPDYAKEDALLHLLENTNYLSCIKAKE